MAAPPSSPAHDGPDLSEPAARSPVTLFAAVVLLALAMSLLGGHGGASEPAASPPGRASVVDTPSPRPSGNGLPRSKPVRLIIPKISVDAPFTALSIGSSGHLNPPPAGDTNLVGWYAEGPSPGEMGTSIIAGHVDTVTSAAVFARLGELEKGDVFRVERADGRTASFTVDDAETFPKDDFPDQRVYADADRAEVRLITCAGDYDHSVKDYLDNLVVFAHLV
ncbi:class F sortase [Streptomyces sp. MS06]|uniref:class F sortase n=1 Tax=Streptomyces sp. MS06 TaxID=3385974 RepID=UPI00399FB8FE